MERQRRRHQDNRERIGEKSLYRRGRGTDPGSAGPALNTGHLTGFTPASFCLQLRQLSRVNHPNIVKLYGSCHNPVSPLVPLTVSRRPAESVNAGSPLRTTTEGSQVLISPSGVSINQSCWQQQVFLPNATNQRPFVWIFNIQMFEKCSLHIRGLDWTPLLAGCGVSARRAVQSRPDGRASVASVSDSCLCCSGVPGHGVC